jgi:hypothetical protein
MEFDGTIRELGAVDSKPLIDAILACGDEAWSAQQYRQQAYSVHEHTQSLVMVFCQGWPNIEVTREPAWEISPLQLPFLGNCLAA